MKILVAGASGQVARALLERAGAADVDLVACGRPDLDIADEASVAAALDAARPDLVINAAAYTAVDKAEAEPDEARRANAVGPRVLAAATASLNVPIIHLSTDYVFDGTASEPYGEADPTAPLGVYGATKRDGETAVADANPRHVIVRTAWVYSPFGANFVKTMLRLAGDRDEVRVVADQLGAPSYAIDIADGLLAVAQNLQAPADRSFGVFHMTGSGEAVWADLAEAVFAASAALGGPAARVVRIPTSDYPTPAARPANSRLDCSKLAAVHGVRLPHWRDSVSECVARLLAAT